MDLYADSILDHYRSPRQKGTLASATIIHTEKNLSCGDVITLELHLNGEIIDDIRWSGEGCAISQAAMSMLAEELIGKNLNDIDALNSDDIRTMLGVPISTRRLKCALLSLHTLKNAIHGLKKEEPQSWLETVES